MMTVAKVSPKESKTVEVEPLAPIKPDKKGHRIDDGKSKKATGFFQPMNRGVSTDALVKDNNIKRLLDGLVKKCDEELN